MAIYSTADYLTYLTGEPDGYAPYMTKITKKDQERIRIKSNLCFQFKSRANPLQYNGIPESERRAMDTLREVISEEEFRKYLRYGFVLVRAKSGAVYQIFKNQSHTKVWVGGKMVEEVCIHIKDEAIPRTDRVVALKAIVETSEEEFKKLGNVYKMAA